MGNRQGLKGKTISIDIETSSLDSKMIADAAAKAASNFGSPNQLLMSAMQMRPFIMMMGGTYDMHPEYAGTPWASMGKLTKREHKVAGLHTFLKKLNVLKNISEEEFEDIKYKSIKRLKKAKWAQYKR